MKNPIPHLTPVIASVWIKDILTPVYGLVMDHMSDPDCPSILFYRILIEWENNRTDIAFAMDCDVRVR